jgi:HEAT repeat protein
LQDENISPVLQRSILASMKRIDEVQSVPYLINFLGHRDRAVMERSAELLSEIGEPAMQPLLESLGDDNKASGALLALEHLPSPLAEPVLQFARAAVARAVEYDALMRGVRSWVRNEALELLAESLHGKAHQHGIRALRAIGLLGDRGAMNTAIQNLQSRDAGQRANVIEALESISAKWREILHPLMRLWEDDDAPGVAVDWERLLNDPDQWIRECAAYAKNYGVSNMDTIATLSLMDRILFFKRVPLFAGLSPADLKQVAAVADEEVFADGEMIAQQGEQGDVMFVIVSGEVRVCIETDGRETEVARRKPGDFVGELAVVNREPRNATLIASGDVRVLCIDNKSFEGLVRERPEVSLVIIQVLSKRLKELMDKKT